MRHWKPNILFIMADQFRADAIGCIGGYTITPNLDNLSRQGCLFTEVFANSAECIPSRISLATGLYPHQTGIDKNCLCTLNPTWPNWMQAIETAGYRTSLFGKAHLHPHTGDLRDRLEAMHRYGFQVVDETAGPRASAVVRSNMTDLWESKGVLDSYRADLNERFSIKPFVARPSPLPVDLYYDCYIGHAARNYLERLSVGEPWFCWVSFAGPHEPWDAPEPYASMYRPEAMPPPRPRSRISSDVQGLLKSLYASNEYCPNLTASDTAALRANYAGNVTLIDDEISKLLQVVQNRGELDRTLIAFTSDHGEMNGDHGLIYKANFLDPTIKVPLIITPPIGNPGNPGTVSSALVELMDLGATLVDYADGQQPPASNARSLRPLIEQGRGEHRPFAVCEFSAHTCLVTHRMKAEFDAAMMSTLAFDRSADPNEQNDLSCSEAYQQAIADLQSELKRFRQATPDVLGVTDALVCQ